MLGISVRYTDCVTTTGSWRHGYLVRGRSGLETQHLGTVRTEVKTEARRGKEEYIERAD